MNEDVVRYMHEGGKEIMAKGFDQVATITNSASSGDHGFINRAKSFICELDFKLQDPDRLHYQLEWTWRDYECMYCVQDGELSGYGIYAFFKDPEGAAECQANYKL